MITIHTSDRDYLKLQKHPIDKDHMARSFVARQRAFDYLQERIHKFSRSNQEAHDALWIFLTTDSHGEELARLDYSVRQRIAGRIRSLADKAREPQHRLNARFSRDLLFERAVNWHIIDILEKTLAALRL